MRTSLIVSHAAALFSMSVCVAARAAPNIHDEPYGPGTENGISHVGDEDRVREGAEIGGIMGGGFASPYAFGVGGRLGYSFRSGFYVGGAYTHFFGPNDFSHADFLGGEGGYKFFPTAHWELRPYGFVGPAFVANHDNNTRVSFAFQPSFLTAYHFGDVFLSGEARGMVAPAPAGFALLVGVGVGL